MSPTSWRDPVIQAPLVGVLSDPRADSGLGALFAAGGCRSSTPRDLRSESPFAGPLGGSSGVADHALAQQDQRVVVAAGHGVGQPAQLDCEPEAAHSRSAREGQPAAALTRSAPSFLA